MKIFIKLCGVILLFDTIFLAIINSRSKKTDNYSKIISLMFLLIPMLVGGIILTFKYMI